MGARFGSPCAGRTFWGDQEVVDRRDGMYYLPGTVFSGDTVRVNSASLNFGIGGSVTSPPSLSCASLTRAQLTALTSTAFDLNGLGAYRVSGAVSLRACSPPPSPSSFAHELRLRPHRARAVVHTDVKYVRRLKPAVPVTLSSSSMPTPLQLPVFTTDKTAATGTAALREFVEFMAQHGHVVRAWSDRGSEYDGQEDAGGPVRRRLGLFDEECLRCTFDMKLRRSTRPSSTAS